MGAHNRVAIFGSARIQEGAPEYIDVYLVAQGLAEIGFDIVTLGESGLMQAAKVGSNKKKSGDIADNLQSMPPCRLKDGRCGGLEMQFEQFSRRLDAFMSISDAVVVATGGLGTLLELFYCWQFIQVKRACEVPVILYGDMWKLLVEWLQAEVMSKNLFDGRGMHSIFHISSADKVVDLIRKINEDRTRMAHVCVNYSRYREEFT